MKYFNIETVTGDLILIRTNRPTPPACPVLAQSTHRRPWTTRIIALLQAIMILFCWYVGRPAIAKARNTSPAIRAGETLAWLRIGSVFLLFSIGTIAAILAARG
jgi:hypothetical protein